MAEPASSQTKEPPKELAVDLGGGVKLDLVLIPAGSFTMGDDNETAHKVRITKPFYLGKYEVTQEQWKAVMGSNPSHFNGPKNPVEQVSWDDCQQFLVKLNTKSSGPGSKFVLPTEAQWEYACGAGSTSKFCFGDDEKQLGEYAWYDANSGDKTHPVGEKKPNAFGLHDMHGNVGEWCQDWYAAYGMELVEPGRVPFAEELRAIVEEGGTVGRSSWTYKGLEPRGSRRRGYYASAEAAGRHAAAPSNPRTGAATWACVSPELQRTWLWPASAVRLRRHPMARTRSHSRQLEWRRLSKLEWRRLSKTQDSDG